MSKFTFGACRICRTIGPIASHGRCGKCRRKITDRFHGYGQGIHANLVKSLGPCEPTTARPGTDEKRRVLAMRAEAGVDLFHADDAVFEWSADELLAVMALVRSRSEFDDDDDFDVAV